MSKEELQEIKENPNIKFAYKIPCSFYKDGFEYIIIGYSIKGYNVKCFTVDDWFNIMESGSLLPYVCSTIGKSGKIKEYLNVFKKPDVVLNNKFIKQLKDSRDKIEEMSWAIQYIQEGKVNRPDVFKKNVDYKVVLQQYNNVIQPILDFRK